MKLPFSNMMPFLLRIASFAFLPVAVIWWLGQLFMRLRIFRQADVVILEAHVVNYGITIHMADLAEILFPGKVVVSAYIWDPHGNQNRYVSEIWRGVTVLELRRPNLFFKILGRNVRLPDIEIHDWALTPITKFFGRIMLPNAEVLSHLDLFARLPIPPECSDWIPRDSSGAISEDWKLRGLMLSTLWTHTLKTKGRRKLRLPEEYRQNIYRKLETVRGGRAARLCMLYIKKEEIGSTVRDGSPMADYVAAMRILVDKGYQVLVTGDDTFAPADYESFDGMLVDHKIIGVEKHLFFMFAPTESEICIGESGAGLLLPMIMGYPTLTLNIFPVGISIASTWVYPKRAVDELGNDMPFEKLFRDHPWGSWVRENGQKENFTLFTNLSDEIADAVKDFLEYVESPYDEDPGAEISKYIPKEAPFHAGGSRLSPAFVRRYHEQSINS
ncbi:MAG: TIGR04372 family glycosyltransferase [Rhodospirillaceae bacterium]|jgi:putative glycosyltransferase (TIGR04372 family)|nr:TIGR04372 family glycosyltransferase [Rhodospirillaceae bacterium]